MKTDFDLNSLVRENIRDLKPYRSARDDFDTGILLDANENSLGAPYSNSQELHRYPMPYQVKLRSKIADYRGVQKDNVFVGVGSDEAIDLLFRIFCIPGQDRVLVNPPTYGMYKVSATINDVGVDEVLLNSDFQLQKETILAAVRPSTKMIFICTPNNPTANSIASEDIITILESFQGIVVIDEAYIDFSKENSCSRLVQRFPNLVVLQTLSKAFGLAGIRLGIAIADPAIINYMLKVKAPYNVNKLTSEAALKAFDHLDTVQEHIQKIISERDRVAKALDRMDAVETVYASDANFFIFKVKDAYRIYEELAAEGVIVRYRGNEPHCEDCLRLTIGASAENDRFLEVLQQILKQD